MAKVAGAYGGLYASHMRGEGKEVVQSVDELIEISEQGHLPAEIFHLKVAYKPGWGKSMAEIGAHVAAARARGDEIAGDLYMYTAGGTGLESTIPSWAFDGGEDALKKRLRDPIIRERLKQEQLTGSPVWWNIIEAAGGWDGIVLVDAANPANRMYEGKTMTVIAKEMGKAMAPKNGMALSRRPGPQPSLGDAETGDKGELREEPDQYRTRHAADPQRSC